MSGVQPRHPASVYRRRRLAVFGGLIAVIAIAVLIIVRPGLGDTAVVEAEPDETLTEEVVAAAPCTAAQIELTPQTDEARYASGAIPSLWLSVKNVGATECELEVGTNVQEYVIDSGSRDNPDLIWSSTHCQAPGTPMTITLQPGEERATGSITWIDTRSTPDTCESDRPTMPGGGASYHLSVKLGTFESEGTKQFILD